MRPHFSYSHGFHSWHGPRRAVWFLIGAGVASFWHQHREAHHHHTHERYFGHCFRPPVHYRPTDNASPPHEPTQWRSRDIPATINNLPPAPMPWGYPEAHKDRQWEEEKQKMHAIGRQAEEVVRILFREHFRMAADGSIFR